MPVAYSVVIDTGSIIALAVSVISAMFCLFQTLHARAQAGEAKRSRVLAEQLAREQAESSKQSADLAQRSAKAAEEMAAIAMKELKRSYRCWVCVESLRPIEIALDNLPLRCLPNIKNYGEVPAQQLRVSTHVRIDRMLPAEADFVDEDFAGASPAIMGPGHEIAVSLSVDYQGKRETVARGLNNLFVFGSFAYLDLAGESCRTTFCCEYIPAAHSFKISSKHNTLT